MKDVQADGSPSKRTGESFTCRIWVKDVLVALHDCGEIVLPAIIDVLEGMAVEKGAQVCENCRKRWRSYGHRVTPTKILDSVVVNMMLYHLDFI
ncbi:hypothetical protein E4U35_000135 [Claviceps purpurea]|nr:hypothetical protein E4U35_000135 [Claviceps purpurea]